ncbi:hypothetical protein DY000_02038144 [Brassica cretica]|uniref:Uncharacterized protein n=1 Tax=Brassica cretica TaxID=69181 RepID=A0ABQ7BIJ9_BRACR|nr:hypothetical protein DY000_02038144 [Brassica cretica]
MDQETEWTGLDTSSFTLPLNKTNQRTRWPQLILFSKVSERGKHLEERFIYFRWSLMSVQLRDQRRFPANYNNQEEGASTHAAYDCHVPCTEEAR